MSSTTVNAAISRWIVLYGIILLCGLCLACGLGGRGFPCPSVDDAMYKSPAAELAQHGRLAIPCARGFLPGAETVFACYPPGYQLALGVWYMVFGVSLRSSLAFSYSVHLLGTAAIMEVTRRLLAHETRAGGELFPASLGSTPLSAGAAMAITAGIGLIHLATLGYFDRPEELALLWVWLALLTARGGSRLDWLRGGLCVGMAGLTVPWVGLLALMVTSLHALLSDCRVERDCRVGRAQRVPPEITAEVTHSQIRVGLAAKAARPALQAAVALSLVAVWYAIMESRYPGAVRAQFSAALSYLKDAQLSEKWGDRPWIFFHTLMYRSSQLPAAVAIIVFFPLAAAMGIRSARTPPALALFASGTVGVLAVAAFRPIAYPYLGASLILFLPCLAPAIVRYCRGSGAAARVGFAMLLLSTIVGWKDVALMSVAAWRTPATERPEQVQRRLTAAIPPGEPVAVLALHWHWFQGRNPWREAHFSSLIDPREVLGCRWLVLSPGLGKPKFIDAFEKVDELVSAQDPARCYGYTLWRRRQAEGQIGIFTAPH